MQTELQDLSVIRSNFSRNKENASEQQTVSLKNHLSSARVFLKQENVQLL